MDPLARLFGTPARLKLLRLFFFNDDTIIPLSEAAFRSRTPKDLARKELTVFLAAGLIKKRQTKKDGKTVMGYAADKRFEHFEALHTFLRTTTSMREGDMVNALKRAGSIRLVTLSGLFTGVIESKADLLIVGDKLDEKALTTAVRQIEAELGRELRFASFTTEQFRYRLGVYDRLLRDIFDYPHRNIFDRLGLSK